MHVTPRMARGENPHLEIWPLELLIEDVRQTVEIALGIKVNGLRHEPEIDAAGARRDPEFFDQWLVSSGFSQNSTQLLGVRFGGECQDALRGVRRSPSA